MATQLSDAELEFSQAFNEDEDAAAEPEAAVEPEVEPEVEAAIDAVAGEAEPEAPPAEALVLETETEPVDDEPSDPKDIQRAKSWEGRLRAREAEIAARERALAEREQAAAEQPAAEPAAEEEAANTPEAVEDRVEEVTAAVQDGSMTAAEALKTLESDFGEEFAQTLAALVQATAAEAASKIVAERVTPMEERLGQADNAVATIIADIKDDRQRQHFEAISAAHPDFAEIAESEMMKSYLDSLSQADREKADKVVAVGSARDIIKLLDAVKKAAEEAEDAASEQDAAVEAAATDAEGVRSRGLRLPEPPQVAEGYEEAWDSF